MRRLINSSRLRSLAALSSIPFSVAKARGKWFRSSPQLFLDLPLRNRNLSQSCTTPSVTCVILRSMEIDMYVSYSNVKPYYSP